MGGKEAQTARGMSTGIMAGVIVVAVVVILVVTLIAVFFVRRKRYEEIFFSGMSGFNADFGIINFIGCF